MRQRISPKHLVETKTDLCTAMAAALRWHAVRVAVVGGLTLFWLNVASTASAASSCCGVTAIAKSGQITAKETKGTRTFQFQVADPALLRALRVGSPVYANFATKQVSLDGKRPCCTIVNLGTQGSSPMGATASGATSGSTKAKTTGGGLGTLPQPDVTASEGSTAGAIRGAAPSSGGQATSQAASAQEPADEDAQDDPESVEKPKPRAVPSLKLPAMRAGAKGTKLTEYTDAQKMLNAIAQGIAAREIDVALLGGEKYKINKCLGVKASAGTFKMKFASPNARIEGSGARLTFRIDRVSMNALKIRMKPNAGNPLKVCHWSKKFTVGGAASDIRYELRFDPVLDLQQCKLSSLGDVKERLDIGGLNLKPLQNDLDRAAKNMIEDAINNAINYNIGDRIIASANAFLGVQCHK